MTVVRPAFRKSKKRTFTGLRVAIMATQSGHETDDCASIRVNGSFGAGDIDVIVDTIRAKLEELFNAPA